MTQSVREGIMTALIQKIRDAGAAFSPPFSVDYATGTSTDTFPNVTILTEIDETQIELGTGLVGWRIIVPINLECQAQAGSDAIAQAQAMRSAISQSIFAANASLGAGWIDTRPGDVAGASVSADAPIELVQMRAIIDYAHQDFDPTLPA
jgi:hypothetical protein